MKKRYKILLIIFGVLAGVIIFSKYQSDKGFKAMDDSNYNTVNVIPEDYKSLFKHPDKVILLGTNTSRYRNPVSDFKYDSSFFIEIYNMGHISDVSLKSFIYEKTADEHITYGPYYMKMITSPLLESNYISGRPEILNRVLLNITGDAQMLLNSDNVCYYKSNFQNFSISYSSDVQDIFVRSDHSDEDNSPPWPIQILFLKKNGNLYFLMMCPGYKWKSKPFDLINEIRMND